MSIIDIINSYTIDYNSEEWIDCYKAFEPYLKKKMLVYNDIKIIFIYQKYMGDFEDEYNRIYQSSKSFNEVRLKLKEIGLSELYIDNSIKLYKEQFNMPL